MTSEVFALFLPLGDSYYDYNNLTIMGVTLTGSQYCSLISEPLLVC